MDREQHYRETYTANLKAKLVELVGDTKADAVLSLSEIQNALNANARAASMWPVK